MSPRVSDRVHAIERPERPRHEGPLEPPVVVIGAPRSGTSMLARTLASADGMCLLFEPDSLWRSGHAYRRSDVATAADLTPGAARWIRERMEAHARVHGARRVVEKTPQNALRVGFVHAVFPDARFVHIVRDGRGVLRSQRKRAEHYTPFDVRKPKVRAHLAERLSDARWWEWPAYAPRVLVGIARRFSGWRHRAWYEIRYPGWRRDRRALTVRQATARQWAAAVEGALDGLAAVPPDRIITVRYEELVADPRGTFRRLFDFLGIPVTDDDLARIVAPVHGASAGAWRAETNGADLDDVLPLMEPALRRLGYLA